jgi:hypothetical protein
VNNTLGAAKEVAVSRWGGQENLTITITITITIIITITITKCVP